MKVTVQSRPSDPKTLADMRVGDVGIIVSEMYKGQVVMRVFGNYFISLTNPRNTWTTAFTFHQVDIFPPGTKIILEIE